MKTRLSSRGQILIPASVRRELGIKPGTSIVIEVEPSKRSIILTPITREHIHSVRGTCKGFHLLETLMEERRRESAL